MVNNRATREGSFDSVKVCPVCNGKGEYREPVFNRLAHGWTKQPPSKS